MQDAKAFEEFLNAEESNVIGIGRSVSDLKGKGTEYLVIEGVIIAKFYNGQMIQTVMAVNGNEKTVISG